MDLFLSCRDFGAVKCCGSCHDDANELFPEYQLSEVYHPDTGELIGEACCIVYSELTPDDIRHAVLRKLNARERSKP